MLVSSRILLVGFALGLPLTGFSRIGEPIDAIENRLLHEGRQGLRVSGSLEDFHWNRVALRNWIAPIEDEVEWHLFYKSTNDQTLPSSGDLYGEDRQGRRGKPLASPPGWLLHVVEYGGQSVLEYYERSGSLSSFEKEGILLLQGEGFEWVKGTPPPDSDLEKPKVFKITHYRSDGKVYASVKSSTMLFYRPELDQMIAEVVATRQKESAPTSIQGF